MVPSSIQSAKAEEKLSYQLKSFWRLWPYLTIAGQFIVVAAPFFLGRAIDAMNAQIESMGPGGAIGISIILLILAYGGFRLFSILLSEGREFIFAPVAQYAQRSVATATFAHLHRLSLRFHLEKRTGGLSRTIERGIRSIDFLFRFLLFNIGPTLLQLGIAGSAFWLAYNWQFALIAVAVVLAYIGFTISTTEYFNAEDFETERYDRAMAGYQKAAILSRTSLATVNIGQSFLMNVGLVALVLLAAQNILRGDMTTGDVFTITMVMMQVYRPLNILGFAYREIKQALTDMEKMFALLDIQPEVQDSAEARAINDIKGAIAFENVAFRYEVNRPILGGVSFTIEPGQTVAVVGPTGAGKSTLSRILFRFYNIASGCVRVDGHDITEITQDSLRRTIGIVPQDTVLFNDTIGYNIGYAQPEATQGEIENAARDAQIHDFITALPAGYDTLVGERGLKLSGGEKQRVAIARTLLKNPAILILDEATSALDSVTERDIQTALDIASKDRTTLVIAHRLSTIIGADKIIVMEAGRIAEQGTHSELLKKQGLYSRLWEQQENMPA